MLLYKKEKTTKGSNNSRYANVAREFVYKNCVFKIQQPKNRHWPPPLFAFNFTDK